MRAQIADNQVSVTRSEARPSPAVRTKDDRQTRILACLAELLTAKASWLVLARWRQESVFTSMGEHTGVGHLPGRAWAEADSNRLNPNPERKQEKGPPEETSRELSLLCTELGQSTLDQPGDSYGTAHRVKIAQREVAGCLRQLEAGTEALSSPHSGPPAQVPLTTRAGSARFRGWVGQKAIVDRIKMTSDDAAEWLIERLAPHHSSSNHIRLLGPSSANLGRAIGSTAQGAGITLATPANPIYGATLPRLCAGLGRTCPGTTCRAPTSRPYIARTGPGLS